MRRRAAIVLALLLGLSGSAIGTSGARIFFLDLRGKLVSANPDGTGRKVLVEGLTGQPDGIAIDVDAGHIYWTNMGAPSSDDGSIQRSDLDGSNLKTIVAAGGTFTAKQLVFDKTRGKLYWSDREGMRVMRANLDGTAIETLIEAGRGDTARQDQRNWCVGLAVDLERGKIYWTQKGGDNANQGSIRRAGINVPQGQTAATRTDIEILFDGLPEPIDLALDFGRRHIYWTDCGNPPLGNTVNRASMDMPAAGGRNAGTDYQVLASGFNEAIGIALDLQAGRMFVTDLRGSVYGMNLDGSDQTTLFTGQGVLTGIAFAELKAATR